MFLLYFTEFHIVVCGLDSIVARRWINGMLVRVFLFSFLNAYDIFIQRKNCWFFFLFIDSSCCSWKNFAIIKYDFAVRSLKDQEKITGNWKNALKVSKRNFFPMWPTMITKEKKLYFTRFPDLYKNIIYIKKKIEFYAFSLFWFIALPLLFTSY